MTEQDFTKCDFSQEMSQTLAEGLRRLDLAIETRRKIFGVDPWTDPIERVCNLRAGMEREAKRRREGIRSAGDADLLTDAQLRDLISLLQRRLDEREPSANAPF